MSGCVSVPFMCVSECVHVGVSTTPHQLLVQRSLYMQGHVKGFVVNLGLQTVQRCYGYSAYLLNVGSFSVRQVGGRRHLLGLAESDSLLDAGEYGFKGGIQLHLGAAR